MEPAYQPESAERRWRERWSEVGLGTAAPESELPAFSIALPPPNITGALHMGHALNAVIQDSLCRFHRMRGYEVLWVPGTDHAAIATQNVIERQLAAEGTSKEEIGREEFGRRVEEWYRSYQGRIVEQLKGMGASCDWSRERFTLDPAYVRVIRLVFKALFDEGLIYRGPRIVNWCPRCQSAISDEEVEYREHEDLFYQVRYPAVEGEGSVVVATTRPETIVADVAVAVPPGDPRFAGMVGRQVREPISGRSIPVIEDEAVDPELGTGALKITPGHAPEDFEIGLRHHLPVLTVISLTGTMQVPEVPELDGLPVADARHRAEELLRSSGALVRADPLVHQVGHCDRCGSVIEPLVTPQWWLRMAELARPAAAAAAEGGELAFHPAHFRAQYLGWLDGLRDWCISRQLWLGHRIPIATCVRGHVFAFVEDPDRCPECGERELAPDPDVLDTWFSSSLWPFAILGWPESTPEMERFYPTSILSTGRDIIYLWVARMVIMGLRFTGELPFSDVIFHATVLGADGARQSKSRGNVVDPLEMVQRHGADALRGWGASVAMGTQDSRFDETRLDGFSRFANKLWNMVRLLHLVHFPDGAGRIPPTPAAPEERDLSDRWVLSRLTRLVAEVTQAMERYDLGIAIESIRRFSWDEVADWYLELAKPRLERGDRAALWTAREVLATTLALLHPIMPFLTDELAQQFEGAPETLDRAGWPVPVPEWEDPEAEAAMTSFQGLAGELRSWLQELGVGRRRGGERVPLLLAELAPELLAPEVPSYLAQLAPVAWEEGSGEGGDGSATLAVGRSVIRLGAGASRHPEVRARMQRELIELGTAREAVERKLGSEFSARAPTDVVERERLRLEALTRREDVLRRSLRG